MDELFGVVYVDVQFDDIEAEGRSIAPIDSPGANAESTRADETSDRIVGGAEGNRRDDGCQW